MKDYAPAPGGYLAVFEQPRSSALFLNADAAFKTQPIVHVAREFECWASCLNGPTKITPPGGIPLNRMNAEALVGGIWSAIQGR
jgi:hypothetical protein